MAAALRGPALGLDMLDLLCLAITTLFFAATAAYLRACEDL